MSETRVSQGDAQSNSYIYRYFVIVLLSILLVSMPVGAQEYRSGWIKSKVALIMTCFQLRQQRMKYGPSVRRSRFRKSGWRSVMEFCQRDNLI